MKVWIPIVSLLGFADAQTCGAPEPTCGVPGAPACGGPGAATCGGPVAAEQCGPPPNLVQTYQPPPRVEYQQQPPQTTYQQQPAQTTYRTEYQYVPGKPIAPPPIQPPKQPPMFNLLVKVQYDPMVKIFEHEVPYIHYDTFEKREECENVQEVLKIEKTEAKNVVRVEEVSKIKKALRVVQHFPEPQEVKVPMFLGTVDETSQTAHHRVWYDLPVDVLRIPPAMEIVTPPLQKTAGHYEKIVRKVTVQPPPVPVTVQPPPVAVTVQQPAVQMVSQVSEQVVQQQATCGGGETLQYNTNTNYGQQEWVVEGGGDGFVVRLDSNNFQSSVSRGYWFVKFFAPWCGHCKRMAPGWETLARDVRVNNWDVSIAEVDCTVSQDICTRYGATGFPTIKLFSNGMEVGQFQGERTPTAYHQYLASRMNQ